MPDVIVPRWDDLHAVVVAASRSLRVVTPFYSEEGITRVLDGLPPQTFVSITTRLSPPDWAAGVADPDALEDLLDLLPDRHSIGILQRLHAKAYVADRGLALVGSSNLSVGGFDRNVELMVRFRGSDAADALDAIDVACAAAKLIDLAGLREWIERARPSIERARQSTVEAAEELAPAQEDLDRLLGFGQSRQGLLNPQQNELREFIEWARRHRSLAGADVIVKRHEDAEGQHLQGHVKQSYFAVRRFLSEHPDTVPDLSGRLADLDSEGIYQVDPHVGDAWVRHVDDHATDQSGDGTWSYAVLRGYMPPSLGGTRQNGGGGSSTLKRMLPLVARYIADAGLA